MSGSALTGTGSVLTSAGQLNSGGSVSFGGAPPIVATLSAAGVALTASRSDHTHGDFTIRVPNIPGSDMVAAINTAIAFAALRGPGGVVELGYGVFECDGQILFDEVVGVTLRGQGKGATTIQIISGGTPVVDGYLRVTDCYLITIEKLSVIPDAPLTQARTNAIQLEGAGTARLVNTDAPSGLSGYLVRDVEIVGCYNGIHLCDSPTPRGAFGVFLEDLNLQPCNGGSGIWIESHRGGMHSIRDVQSSTLVPTSLTPALAHVRVTATGDVTMSDINTYQGDYGLLVDPGTGELVNYIGVINSVFDTCTYNSLKMASASAGTVNMGKFENTWFASPTTATSGVQGYCVAVGNGMQCVTFVNCHSENAIAQNPPGTYAGGGFLAYGTATRIDFVHCDHKGVGHIAFGVSDTASACRIQACDPGPDRLGNIPDIGIYIGPTASNIMSGQHKIRATTATAGVAPTVSLGANMNY